MPFPTLEERFNQRARSIYNKFSNTEQLDEIKPDTKESRSRIKNDSQLLPVVSTVRDVKLLSKFLATGKGVLFLGKQTLLQTGNTFAETRLYNPLGSIINAVPAVHALRHLGKPASFSVSSLTNLTRDYRGSLQEETVANFLRDAGNGGLLAKFRGQITSTLSSPVKAVSYKPDYTRPEDILFFDGPALAAGVSKEYRGNLKAPNPYKNGAQIQNNRRSGFIISNNVSNANLLNRLQITANNTPRTNLFSGQEYTYNNTYSSYINASPTSKNSYFKTTVSLTSGDLITNGGLLQSRLAPTSILDATRYAQSTTGFTTATSYNTSGEYIADITQLSSKFADAYNKYTSQTTDGKNTGVSTQTVSVFGQLVQKQKPYFESAKSFQDGYGGDNGFVAKDVDGLTKSTIRDLYNRGFPTLTEEDKKTIQTGKVIYSSIVRSDERELQEGKSDIIRFVFRSSDGTDPVHFRAFINQFSENVKPEFNEQKYLGRTERFVTYAGAKRSATLNFNIVAFSEGEIDNVWLRVNYLAGLAFPKGASPSGFMIPPLFKLTIGGIYDNQPCYLDSLDFDFIDDKITFDIDKEVSQYINVKMTVQLLEKTTRFYNSPFYEVANKLAKTQLLIASPPPVVNIPVVDIDVTNQSRRQREAVANINPVRTLNTVPRNINETTATRPNISSTTRLG